MEAEAQQYLDQARQLATNGSYGKAFDLYLLSFEKHSDFKILFETEFRSVLMHLNEELYDAGKMEQIFSNFGKAVNVYPCNYILLNEIGKYLYKFHFYTEAWAHFQKALRINYKFVSAEKNLNSVKNLLVERWHFRMLNDKIRNEAYKKALDKSIVRLRDSVVDIGTGTGILAMIATDCKAAAVTAIESSESMTCVAENVTQGNDKNNIMIVNDMSTRMNYKDIGGKRSVIVTEIFDAGLFGEHILQTLSHAWEYFSNPSTRIIPNKAEFFVVPVNSKHLILKYQLSKQAKEILDIDYDVHVIINNNETYDCEDVHLTNDIDYLAAPQSLLKVNFNEYVDVQEKLNGTRPFEVEFKALKDGEMNLIIGWFNLYLAQDVTITTDPTSDQRANAWQHAVFFDRVAQPVKKDEVILSEFYIDGGKLGMVNINAPTTRLSPETLRFLNDHEYIKMISECIGMASIYLGQITDISQIDIIDLCPFPMFGFLMMKRGAQSLVCHAKTETDKDFIKEVFTHNKLTWSNVTVYVGEQWGANFTETEKYHAIFSHLFDMSGDIEEYNRDIALELKEKYLVRGGLFLPADIQLIVQVVNSDWVDLNNRVHDENVLNYKIADHINKYRVSQNFFIDFSQLEYTPVSKTMNLGTLSDEARLEIINIPITKAGPANAILCWYSIEIMKDTQKITTDRPGSFMDGMLFLIDVEGPLKADQELTVAYCVDGDGMFKLILEKEANK